MLNITLVTEIPVILYDSGDVVVPGIIVDISNIMIIAGKDFSGTKAEILISNLNSDDSILSITVKNLPFSAADIVKIEQYKTQDSGSKHELTTDTVVGSSTITVTITSVNVPSVYLLKISKSDDSGIGEMPAKEELTYYPNPADESLNFSETIENIEVYNIFGEPAIPQIKSANAISVKELHDGIYFIRSDKTCFKIVVSH